MNYHFLFTLANLFKKETICDYLIKKKNNQTPFSKCILK